MKKHLCLCAVAALLAGCSSTLPECDFAIVGEACQWENRIFHIGKKLNIDGKNLSLPDEVCEVNAFAWKTDLNGDGKMDYLLSVAGMGNGKNFGNGVLYIFLSGINSYQCLKQEYGGFLNEEL